MIEENQRLSFETELAWLQKIRDDLGIPKEEEMETMSYAVQVNNNRKYIEYLTAKEQVRSEQDALELIAKIGRASCRERV